MICSCYLVFNFDGYILEYVQEHSRTFKMCVSICTKYIKGHLQIKLDTRTSIKIEIVIWILMMGACLMVNNRCLAGFEMRLVISLIRFNKNVHGTRLGLLPQ